MQKKLFLEHIYSYIDEVSIKPQPINIKRMLIMNYIRKLIAMTAVMSLCATQIQAQDYCQPCETPCEAPCGDAYCDSGCASYLSAALPIGALVVAAIIIATTNRHHHHSSSSCSSSSFSHCDSGSSSSFSCSSF